jgi:hypothetical protein
MLPRLPPLLPIKGCPPDARVAACPLLHHMQIIPICRQCRSNISPHIKNLLLRRRTREARSSRPLCPIDPVIPVNPTLRHIYAALEARHCRPITRAYLPLCDEVLRRQFNLPLCVLEFVSNDSSPSLSVRHSRSHVHCSTLPHWVRQRTNSLRTRRSRCCQAYSPMRGRAG